MIEIVNKMQCFQNKSGFIGLIISHTRADLETVLLNVQTMGFTIYKHLREGACNPSQYVTNDMHHGH